MRRIATTFLFAVAAFAAAQTEAEFKAASIKMCAGYKKAFESRDIKFFESTSTSDFVYIDFEKNKQTKAQSMASMKNLFATAKTLTVQVTCGKYSFAKGVGKHVSTAKATVTLLDKDNKSHTLVITTTTEETLKKVGGAWKVSMVRELSKPVATMDGKPIGG